MHGVELHCLVVIHWGPSFQQGMHSQISRTAPSLLPSLRNPPIYFLNDPLICWGARQRAACLPGSLLWCLEELGRGLAFPYQCSECIRLSCTCTCTCFIGLKTALLLSALYIRVLGLLVSERCSSTWREGLKAVYLGSTLGSMHNQLFFSYIFTTIFKKQMIFPQALEG